MLPQAKSFLELILPPTGVYCAIHFAPGVDKVKPIHEWYASIDEVADRVEFWDKQGYDTYHACSSFTVAGTAFAGRRQANVAEVASFWLDLDCGTGKGYPNQRAAAEALAAFCADTGLPGPTLVSSGWGLHAYWPLEAPLTGGIWRQHADQLRELCTIHGLKADPARTADQASILRTPGTHNYKRSERAPVALLRDSGLLPNDKILTILASTTTSPLPPFDQQLAQSMSVELGQIGGKSPPSYADMIAAVCPQMRIIRETRGNVPEPVWYAGLTVLARCEDGPAVAQAWSAGHPNYSPAETERKLEHARQAPGPATCAQFDALNPGPCGNCPNRGKVKSPIVLGVTDKLAGAKGPTEEEKARENEPKPPPGYFSSKSGAICYEVYDKDTEQTNVEILYRYPLWVAALRNGESRSDTHVIIRHFAPGRGFQSFSLPMMAVKGATLAGHLGQHDIDIPEPDMRRMRDYLSKSFAACVDEERRQMGYEQFGWKDDGSFLLGLRLYKPDGMVQAVGGDDEVERRGQFFETRGKLEHWKPAAQQFFYDGMEAHAFTLLCGFAAPLMAFTEDAGTIVSLLGPSGHGKSQAATGAMSIYGLDEGMELKTNDNAAPRFTAMGVLNNLPIVTNDAHKMTDDQAQNYALNFTDGRDKMRGRVDGGIIAPKRAWKTIMICTCNKSLVDKIGTPEDAKRIFEFYVKLPDHAKMSDGALQLRQLRANRGTAGDYWIRFLVHPDNRAKVKQLVEAMITFYGNKLGNRPEDRFWIRLLAVVSAAGRLVNAIGLLEFSLERLMQWALAQLLELREGAAGTEQSAVNNLARFIDRHRANTLTVFADQQVGRGKVVVHSEPRGPLFIRVELCTTGIPERAYIEQKAFRAWCAEESVNTNETRSELVRMNIVERWGHLFVLGKGTSLSSGQVKVMEINMTKTSLTGELEKIDGGKSAVA
jgi:hypothetical protein